MKLADNIYWVGAIDWNVRNFHGYLTQRGTSYNAFLIIDEKITLVDTVKSNFTSEMMERIKALVNPADIDYVVCNHVEMDHSGALPFVMEQAPNAQLVASPKGMKGLEQHYKANWKMKPVKTGDELQLGKNTLSFIQTPMVHWPDNMVCFLKEQKILFSNDIFGQHYASHQRFDDECPKDIVMEEARKYYANIVLPYAKQVVKAYEEISQLDMKMIFTSHGVCWRKGVRNILNEYKKWAGNQTVKKALVVYDSMWGSTEIMARNILFKTFEEKGYVVELRNLQATHISDIMTDFMDAEFICVGSPTLNNNVMPNVAAFLTYLNGLSPRDRKAVAFGSYGWGGHSIANIKEALENAGFDVKISLKTKYIPDEEEQKSLIDALKEAIE